MGKNHRSPRTPTITIGERYNQSLRGNELDLCIFANRWLQQSIALFLSLSLSMSLSLYNNMTITTTLQSDCPKSCLYLYELRAIYKYSLNRLTQNIFTDMSSLSVLTGSPPISGSLPVLTGSSLFITGSHPERPISQQTLCSQNKAALDKKSYRT